MGYGPFRQKGRQVSSAKQIAANRGNALASTGPRSPEGKQTVSRNALKHGILSRSTLLPGEDETSFTELRNCLFQDLNPVGPQQELLVERIVAYNWRLKRLFAVEANLFISNENFLSQDRSIEWRQMESFFSSISQIEVLGRYEVCIERMLAQAINQLEVLKRGSADGD